MEEMTWSVPEYADRERSVDWFWGVGFVALLGVAASIYLADYLFAVLIVIAAFSLGIFAVRKPRHIEYGLSEKGLRIDETRYPFSTLASFWVEKIHHTPKIIIVSKKFFMPVIIVPFVDHDEDTVRDFLLDHLPEVEHHEPFLHVVAERLGF
jgi:hypothetical protein